MDVDQAGPAPIETRYEPLPSLTPLRFVAALYVIAAHARLDEHLNRLPAAGNFIRSGYTGVTLFFVLSGFILTYNYRKVTDPVRFWMARFARIYPVYLLAFLAVLALFAPHPSLWWHFAFAKDAAISIVMLQAWFEPTSVAVNPPSWTLSVEAFFYAIFPWLSPWIARLGQLRFALWQLGWSLLVLLPISLAHWHAESQALQLAHLIEGTLPILRLNSFVVGIFLGNIYISSQCQTPGRTNWALPVGSITTVLLLCYAPSPLFLPLRTLLLSYSFGLLILGLAPLRYRWLSTPWVQTLGGISYSVYILQFPVARVLYFFELRLLHSSSLNIVLFLATLIPVSYAVFRWYEGPARLAILKLTKRLHPPSHRNSVC